MTEYTDDPFDLFRFTKDGWIHHWDKKHEKHEGPFPDCPYVTGLAYLGILLRHHPYGFSSQEVINIMEGMIKRTRYGLPGNLVRDVGMTGYPDELMLNRDQWQFILYPMFVVSPGIVKDHYNDWRSYAKFRPRHWLLPNHSSWFDRYFGGSGSTLGDLFELWNIKLSPRNVNRTVSSGARIMATISMFPHSKYMKEAFRQLDKKTNIEEDFKEYFTRSIPGDPPGEHPRVDKIWKSVIRQVREKCMQE